MSAALEMAPSDDGTDAADDDDDQPPPMLGEARANDASRDNLRRRRPSVARRWVPKRPLASAWRREMREYCRDGDSL